MRGCRGCARTWGLGFAVLLALGPGPARAEDALPTLDAIRAKVRAATALPSAYKETYVIVSSDGSTNTTTSVVRGDDERQATDVGPFHTESGTFKDQDWHQNDNGQTVIDQPDPGNAKPDPIATRVTRVAVPVDAYVIAKLNVRGQGTRDYVDPQTWRIVRHEVVTANGVVATTYDDFRADAGRTFAHHWITLDGYQRTKREAKVIAYDPGPVSDADVAMPDSRRRLVEFPRGTTTVTLPTKFGESHVFVRLTINGRGLDFVLDTGAEGITLDNTVAAQLGLPVFDRHSAVTAGRYTTGRTIVPELRIGELAMHNVAVQLVPEGWPEDAGVRSVGLLGFDFLAELGVTIDYEHQTVTVVPEPNYMAPADAHTIPLDVRIGEGSPFLDVRVNGALGERFLIDTGASGTFMIFDAFVRKHPEALVDRGGGDGRNNRYYGIGGDIETKPYQLSSVRIGPMNFTDFVGYRVMSTATYEGNDDGVIGAAFLNLFTVGLDYANNRVYLVPNTLGRRVMGIKR